MAINGRINVDVLFHDTDGTTSLKVVSLQDSTEYTTGKVAIVTGTVGTSAITVDPQAFGDLYRDASGNSVAWSDGFYRLAFKSSAKCKCVEGGNCVLVSNQNRVSVCDTTDRASNGLQISVVGTAGTASYTLVMYGT